MLLHCQVKKDLSRLGLSEYKSSNVVWVQFLYFKLFTDLQAALYSSVGFSYNLLLLCIWISAPISIFFFKELTKISVSDNTSEYGLQRKWICFDKLLFLNPNQNFIEFIMKSHWWILEVGCNAVLMSSPQIHGPYIIGGYRHWIIYKWNY